MATLYIGRARSPTMSRISPTVNPAVSVGTRKALMPRDPDPAGPELTVFELRDGRYFLAAKSTQPLTVAHPFEVTIVPANLTKGLPR